MTPLSFRALALRPFVPSGADFARSSAFLEALGFVTEWSHDGLAGLRLGAASVLLQDIDVPVWQENQMLVLAVDDLDAFWAHVVAVDLLARFPGTRANAPTDYPWGREVHLIDPAGVCWHVRQERAPRGLQPVTLEGRHVRLVPLELGHLPALAQVGLDEDLWRWTPAQVRTEEDMRAYVAAALGERERGTALPFVTLAQDTVDGTVVEQVAGSTRYGNYDGANLRVEIGWTWVARPWQRTAVNTEAKLLMLRHAFDVLGCRRVELKTDALNARSRAAILRLGAEEEGTLKNHIVTASGRMRDTVYFGITNERWPEVERRLVAMLGER
ncbi:MAG: GNAT family N-acetyltransferase [Planctomycetota bacterium]